VTFIAYKLPKNRMSMDEFGKTWKEVANYDLLHPNI
jgi:hypothetical protein